MCELHCSDFAQQGSSEQQEGSARWRTVLEGWMAAHDLTMDSDCFVVKPADESHGVGVLLVNDTAALEQHAQLIFRQVSCT